MHFWKIYIQIENLKLAKHKKKLKNIGESSAAIFVDIFVFISSRQKIDSQFWPHIKNAPVFPLRQHERDANRFSFNSSPIFSRLQFLEERDDADVYETGEVKIVI